MKDKKSPADVMREKAAVQPQGQKRQMYPAVCADCKKACEVPFQPTSDRPAYCKDCFMKRRAALQKNQKPVAQKPGFSGGQGMGDLARKLDMVNSKLDALILKFETHVTTSAVAPKVPAKKAAAKKKVSKKK